MGHLAALGIVVSLLAGCAATRATDSTRPHGWSIARPTPTHIMPDSTYQRLSHMPADSLTASERMALQHETRVRAQEPGRTTLLIKTLLVVVVFGAIAYFGRIGGVGL